MTSAEPAGSRRGFLHADDGTRLHYRVWDADHPAATLLLVHGLFEHSGRYEAVGAALAARGISTFGLDHRGHGHSGGPRGHARRFELLLDDLRRFRADVAPVGPPTFLLAHSFGGLVGIRYLQEGDEDTAGAVLSSPWLGTSMPVPAWKVAMARVLSPVLPALPTTVRIDAEDLSRDPERVRDYRDDPRIHQVLTPRMYSEVTRALERAHAGADRLDLPLLFLLAGEDRIVDTERSLRFARSIPSGDVQIDVLDGARHETLQDVDRHRVVARIRDWILDRAP